MKKFEKILVKKIWSNNPDRFKNITLSSALKRYQTYINCYIQMLVQDIISEGINTVNPDVDYDFKSFEDWLETEI